MQSSAVQCRAAWLELLSRAAAAAIAGGARGGARGAGAGAGGGGVSGELEAGRAGEGLSLGALRADGRVGVNVGEPAGWVREHPVAKGHWGGGGTLLVPCQESKWTQ